MEQYRFKGGMNLIYTILMFATIFGLLDNCGGVRKTYSPYDSSVVMSGTGLDDAYVLSKISYDGLTYVISSKHAVSREFVKHHTTRDAMCDIEGKFLSFATDSTSVLENVSYIESILPDFAILYQVRKVLARRTDILWRERDNR